MKKIPLCIDLDGTLIRNDTTKLALAALLKKNILYSLLLPLWLLSGLASFKRQIAKRVTLDASTFLYNENFLAWLKQQKSEGRPLLLVSATDQKFADAAARYVGIFDEVLASDGKINLRSKNKRDALSLKFGEGQYDYAGNDYPDIAVWRATHKAIIVNAPARLLAQCRRYPNIGEIFE